MDLSGNRAGQVYHEFCALRQEDIGLGPVFSARGGSAYGRKEQGGRLVKSSGDGNKPRIFGLMVKTCWFFFVD